MTTGVCSRTCPSPIFASAVLIVILLLAVTAAASEQTFIERWSAFDEILQVQDHGPSGYRKRVEMPFTALVNYPGTLSLPSGTADIERVLVLSSQPDRTVLLVTPKNTLGGTGYLGEQFKQELKRCAGDRSWLVALPENTWSPVDLNPYCTMDYDDSGILFDLYWTRYSSRPMVDISTNGFKCVSHRLYAWDGKTSRYVQKAQKCTGSRPRERYSLSGPMRQVYPPGGTPEGRSGQLQPWTAE